MMSVILDTGINCGFQSLRLCTFAPLRFHQYNAKAQRRRDAKEVISVVTSFVLLCIRLAYAKSSICGGAKYNSSLSILPQSTFPLCPLWRSFFYFLFAPLRLCAFAFSLSNSTQRRKSAKSVVNLCQTSERAVHDKISTLCSPVSLLLLLLLASGTGTASAGIIYTDQIDIRADTISVQITETYTGNDAAIVKKDISNDRSAYIEQAEGNLLAWSTSYLVIDDDSSLIAIREVDVEVAEVAGSYIINSTLEYEIAMPLDRSSADVARFRSSPCTAVRELMSRNRHSLWIQGHPAVANRVIIIPPKMEMESIAGLGDTEIATLSDRVTITGVSATRKFLNGSRTTFEYATVVRISTKPIYAHPWFLPTLVMIEIALLGLWWMKRGR